MTASSNEQSRLLDENLKQVTENNLNENDIITYVSRRRASLSALDDPYCRNSDGTINHTSMIPNRNVHLDARKSRESSLADILSQADALIEGPHTNLKVEVKTLLKYTLPLVITFLLQYSLTVSSVFSVGRLGSDELAAISLSSMTANISGYAIIQGVSTCLDTLCAQAYGRKDYESVGRHFVKCTYCLFLLFGPVCFIWVFFSKSILLFLVGEDYTLVCSYASRYLQILSFGIPGYILFENGKHFLQAQGIFHASTYVLLFAAPLNAALNYILVWHHTVGIGFAGAPLAVVITDWVMAILLFLYIFFVKGNQCWPKTPLTSGLYFRDWQRMINLSIPGVLMVEAEWLAFEIVTFTSAKFGTTVLAAQSIINTTCGLLYQIPFALSIASSTRIAWFIGAASKESALVATRASMYSALSIGIISGAFIYTCRHLLASLYSNDKSIVSLASTVLKLVAVYQVNDFISCATAGVLRSQGRQKIGGILNLISYYVVALPIAFFCGFYLDMGLTGLWVGMLCGLVFVSLAQYYFVQTSDWESIVEACICDALTMNGRSIEAHSLIPSMSNNSQLL